MLAKALPGFTQEKRLESYKEVLRESLEEGYVNSSSSLQVLAQLRQQLTISDDEHQDLLLKLGVEDPSLMDPNRLHSLENSVRLSGYRRALERMLTLQNQHSIEDMIAQDPVSLRQLRQDCCITSVEEDEIWQGLDLQAEALHRSQLILKQLKNLIQCFHALNQPQLLRQTLVLSLLRASIKQKKRLLVRALLELIESSSDNSVNLEIAQQLAALSPMALSEVLHNPMANWNSRLCSEIIQKLSDPGTHSPACSLDITSETITSHLQDLIQESNPNVNLDLGRPQAQSLLESTDQPLVRTIAAALLQQGYLSLVQVPDLEKLTYLFNAQLFSGIHTHTLLELAAITQFKLYQANDIISDEGDNCRELLILIEGKAEISVYENNQLVVSSLLPGQILDELEVLSHGRQSGRIVALASPTRLLAVAVDQLDPILARDPDLSRRILEWEAHRLQQVLHNSLASQKLEGIAPSLG